MTGSILWINSITSTPLKSDFAYLLFMENCHQVFLISFLSNFFFHPPPDIADVSIIFMASGVVLAFLWSCVISFDLKMANSLIKHYAHYRMFGYWKGLVCGYGVSRKQIGLGLYIHQKHI